MTHLYRIIWALVLLAIAMALGLFVGWNLAIRSQNPYQSGSSPSSSLAADHGTLVVTASATLAEVQHNIVGYGMVGTASDGLRTKSLPYECVILKEVVNLGQHVAAGETLLEVQGSQQERLAASKALAELEAAQELQKMVHSKIELKLATKQDLILAGLRVKQAQRVVDNMRRLGIDKVSVIRATTAGIVASIGVQQGQLVPAGRALVSLTDTQRLIVDLGIEPEDIRFLEENQAVELVRVHSAMSKPITSRIKTLTRSVDPKTRLVRVLIKLESGSNFMLNEFIEAHIAIGSHTCPTVPKSCVLTDEKGQYVFTISDGRAQRISVKTGFSGDAGIEILGHSIKVGDRVVTLGNHELKTGMQVREERSLR